MTQRERDRFSTRFARRVLEVGQDHMMRLAVRYGPSRNQPLGQNVRVVAGFGLEPDTLPSQPGVLFASGRVAPLRGAPALRRDVARDLAQRPGLGSVRRGECRMRLFTWDLPYPPS